jgi:NAD-dependent SIR2 family protein deacetylase
MLSLGSSLRVNPAAEMAKITAQNGKNLVIINLQNTPLDKYASLRIYAKIDDAFQILMKKLNFEIP